MLKPVNVIAAVGHSGAELPIRNPPTKTAYISNNVHNCIESEREREANQVKE